MVDRRRCGHPQQDGLKRKQPPGLKRITFQSHSQSKDKFQDENPPRDKRTHTHQQNRVEDEKSKNGEFVPGRGVVEKILYKSLRNCRFHRSWVTFHSGDAKESLTGQRNGHA